MQAAQTVRFGVFSLGGVQFALPMEALREVIPCRAFEPLPSPMPSLVGGVNLRDVLVPVLDLRVLLNHQGQASEFPCVVIMAHEGKVLGLLADGVSGIFSAESSEIHRQVVNDPVSAVVHGNVHWADAHALVNVLSAQALAALPQVPMVDDPEPQRIRLGEERDEVVIQDASLPVMLVRCGSVPLALNALTVHTTVSNVEVLPSPLAMGHCLGVMAYGGLHVPAIDLLALCGLGALPPQALHQAFILQLPQGFVACLVSEVVDVVRIQPDVLVPLVSFSLARADMFEAALPMAVLPQEVAKRTAVSVNQYLLIHADALKDTEELVNLSATNVAAPTAQSQQTTLGQAGAGSHAGVSMIVYALAADTATPFDQIEEILPYTRDAEVFGNDDDMLGLMINRGRSIPVMCLSRMMGGPACVTSSTTSVLVVAANGQHIGFAVNQLKSIETAQWEPDLPSTLNGHHRAAAGSASGKLAQMGHGPQARMLPVVDLARLAQHLCNQGMPETVGLEAA